MLLKIRWTKHAYYRSMINNSKPHERWDVLNTIADKRKKSRDIKELTYEGNSVTESTEIANVLNTYFSNIGYKINNELKQTATQNTSAWMINPHGLKLHTITSDNIYKIINSLPDKKKVEYHKYQHSYINYYLI